MRSTTELLGHACGGGGGIRTPEAMTQLIYSQSPLATWVPHREYGHEFYVKLELPSGLEPETYRLQGGCSTS